MAEGKKSFVLYADLKETIKKLVENDRINKTNNAGELFLHILEYVSDSNPEPINFIVDVSFEPIKQQLKRDLLKFKEVKEKRSDAGKASAEAKKLAKLLEQNATNSTSVESVEQTSTNSTVNDNVNDNVNDINKPQTPKGASIDFDLLLVFYNKVFKKKATIISDATRKKYNSILKQGYTKDNISRAMVACAKDTFHIENNYKYCSLDYFTRVKTIDMHGFEAPTVKPVTKGVTMAELNNPNLDV
jgi:hypothetical protein